MNQLKDTPQPTQEAASADMFDNQLQARLANYIPRFEEIKRVLGVDNSVGLASLPRVHDGLTMGALPEIQVGKEGFLLYKVRGLGGSSFVKLPAGETRRIISVPSFERTPIHVVTMYQKRDPIAEHAPETKFLNVPDSVLDGVAAHELTHWVVDIAKKPIPPHIKTVLEKRDQDIAELLKDSRDIPPEIHHDDFSAQDEAKIDITAALYGFKDAILAQLNYAIACTESYGIQNYGTYLGPQEILPEFKYRRNQVLKYADK